MRLYTFQPVEVAEMLKKEKSYICDTDQISFSYFKEAYYWMADQMKQRISPPSNAVLPIWGWHTWNWSRNLDLTKGGFGTPGETYACIELEIPESQVLLSDFDEWHYVLNNEWNDDSVNEADWEEKQKWFDSLTKEQRDEITRKSWQKIFDITPYHSEWRNKGQYIQATFWEIKPEMVVKISYYTEKENLRKS